MPAQPLLAKSCCLSAVSAHGMDFDLPPAKSFTVMQSLRQLLKSRRMRKSRFIDAQIIGMIKEQEAGMPTSEICHRHGLSPATLYKLKARYGGMEISEAARLKALEDENAKRKRLLADTMLDLS